MKEQLPTLEIRVADHFVVNPELKKAPRVARAVRSFIQASDLFVAAPHLAVEAFFALPPTIVSTLSFVAFNGAASDI